MKTEQYKIELSEDAEADFDSSYRFYENKSSKVANKFFIQINNSF